MSDIEDEISPSFILSYLNNDDSSESEDKKSVETSISTTDDTQECAIFVFVMIFIACLSVYTLRIYSILYNVYIQENNIDYIWCYVLSCSTLLNFMYYTFLKAYYILETSKGRIYINIANILMHSGYCASGYYILEKYTDNNVLYDISVRYYYSHYVMIFLLSIRNVYLKWFG